MDIFKKYVVPVALGLAIVAGFQNCSMPSGSSAMNSVESADGDGYSASKLIANYPANDILSIKFYYNGGLFPVKPSDVTVDFTSGVPSSVSITSYSISGGANCGSAWTMSASDIQAISDGLSKLSFGHLSNTNIPMDCSEAHISVTMVDNSEHDFALASSCSVAAELVLLDSNSAFGNWFSQALLAHASACP